MFSRPLLGTNTDKTKLTWFEYIWYSCIIQGWYNCFCSFRNWADLMGNNYEGYALLQDDDPLEQCVLYFWDSLEDDIYPKEFLDHLLQLTDDIKTGKEKIVPLDEDFFNRVKELTDGVELDIDEELENE
jgi:hypothetical protein